MRLGVGSVVRVRARGPVGQRQQLACSVVVVYGAGGLGARQRTCCSDAAAAAKLRVRKQQDVCRAEQLQRRGADTCRSSAAVSAGRQAAASCSDHPRRRTVGHAAATTTIRLPFDGRATKVIKVTVT